MTTGHYAARRLGSPIDLARRAGPCVWHHGGMSRRKSIARRRPIAVYRIECDESTVQYKAWFGDEDTGRISGAQVFDKTWAYSGETFRSQWVDSRDTEAIHALPELVRDVLWKIDDAIRS